jgi:DNA-binding transcriptional ArsR family regulator
MAYDQLMGSAQAADVALDALGDPTRRSILRLLSERPRSVQHVADELPVSRPAVPQHLRVLEGAGLVSAERHGTRRIYHLDATGAAAARAFLDEMWDVALARFALLAENTTPAPAPGRALDPKDLP